MNLDQIMAEARAREDETRTKGGLGTVLITPELVLSMLQGMTTTDQQRAFTVENGVPADAVFERVEGDDGCLVLCFRSAEIASDDQVLYQPLFTAHCDPLPPEYMCDCGKPRHPGTCTGNCDRDE